MLRKMAESIIKSLLERFGYPIYTAKYGLAKGLKVTGDLGFLQFRHQAILEEDFLQDLELTGKIVYDIGAHIGIMALFFSRSVGQGGRVIAFEPNPQSCVTLHKNLDLNDLRNVTIAQVGLGDKRETKALVFGEHSRGAGSMDDTIQTQILSEKGSKALQVQVEVYTLDEYVETNRLPIPDFVKIDVEGMEYNVMLGMMYILDQYSPTLFVEIHGATEEAKLANIQRVVDFLDSWAYDIYHVESGQTISTATVYIAKEGHIYCTNTERRLDPSSPVPKKRGELHD